MTRLFAYDDPPMEIKVWVQGEKVPERIYVWNQNFDNNEIIHEFIDADWAYGQRRYEVEYALAAADPTTNVKRYYLV